MPNLASLALFVVEIWRGSQNLKSRARDPDHVLLTQFYIFCLVPLRIILRAKFGVSSFVRYEDIQGVLKFKK